MAIVYESMRMTCLSTDTKPTTAQDGQWFYETDTNSTYDFTLSTTTWTVRASGATLGDIISLG